MIGMCDQMAGRGADGWKGDQIAGSGDQIAGGGDQIAGKEDQIGGRRTT